MKKFTDLMNESYNLLNKENKELRDRYLKQDMLLPQQALPILCLDGYKVSIQASWSHYCSPKQNFPTVEGDNGEVIVTPDYDMYDSFELGFPSRPDDLIAKYAEDPENLTETVYSRVPKAVIEELLSSHGGAVGFYSPKNN